MASILHQIARNGVVEAGENFFREATDSHGRKAANALDGMQRTPLHLACWASKVDMIRLLIKHRADVMAGAQDNFTPLHFCSQAGCAEGCRVLLAAGAKVDAKLNKTRKTSLHLAAAKGHAEAVRVLVEAGADTSIENSKRETAADLATKADVKAALAGEQPEDAAGGDFVAGSVAHGAAAAHQGDGEDAGAKGQEVAGEGGKNAAGAAERNSGAAATTESMAGGAAMEEKEGPEECRVRSGEGRRTAGSSAGPENVSSAEPVGGEAGEARVEARAKQSGQQAEGKNGHANGVGRLEEGRGGGVAVGGGGERVGSLAERRRKKRKLAKEATVRTGVSLSHLGGDGED